MSQPSPSSSVASVESVMALARVGSVIGLDLHRRIRAEVERLSRPVPDGWQLISSAPKDGTDILLASIEIEHGYIGYVERGYFEMVAEDEEDGPWDIRDGEPWCSYQGRPAGLYWCYSCGPDDFDRRGIRFLDSSDCLKFTHWMPLASPLPL